MYWFVSVLFAYLALSFIKVAFLKSEKRTHSVEFDRLLWKKFEFFGDLFDFSPVPLLDPMKQKRLNFCLFEEESHDKIVNIFILDQFSIFLSSQMLESIDIRDNCNHKLHKNANFINDSRKLRKRNSLKIVIEFPIQRLKKSSKSMLLKNISPFQKDMQWRWIILQIDFFFV